MRKSFKHILLAGLTIASTAMAMNAQTLTQDWKVTEGLPTAGNARWGIGFDGKVYTNDKSVPQIIAINAEGKTTVATSAAGTAITVDGAGNFIVNDGFPNATSSTTFKILPAGTTEMIDLTVALPRENGEVVVAAPSKYDINISSDEYPASVYIIGSNNVWNPEDGVKLTKGENGVYTGL